MSQLQLSAHPQYRRCAPTALVIRPLQPEDAGLLYAMHQRLSVESIYARYLSYRHPGLAEFASISAMAPTEGFGVVASLSGGGAQLVGLAYYRRDPTQPDTPAELGMLVEDQHQGMGIGRLLYQAIAQQALSRQIHHLRVLFHPSNFRVLRMIQASGYCYRAGVESGLNYFTLLLREQPIAGRDSRSWDQSLQFNHYAYPFNK